MKCKPYSETTVEIRTQLKTVKITSNIFALWGGGSAPQYFADQLNLLQPRGADSADPLLPAKQTFE